MEDLARAQIYAQVQQAQFMLPIEVERERQLGEIKAQLAGKEWEARYSAQDKMRMAKWQRAIKAAVRSGAFNPRQIQMLKERYLTEWMGLEQDFFPKSEQQKQIDAWAEEGKGVGVEWTDEQGNVKTRKPNGEIQRQTDFINTRDGQILKAQQELLKEIREWKQKLTTEEIEYKTTDKKGNPITKYHRRTPAEVEAIIQDVYGGMFQQQPQQQPQLQPPQNLPVVRSEADRAALPPGAVYIYNGQKFQKPGGLQQPGTQAPQLIGEQPRTIAIPQLSPFSLSY